MAKTNTKTVRYSMRINPAMRERLSQISQALHAPLPDLLIVGALHLYAQATNPGAYWSLKARLYASDDDATKPAA